MTQAAAVKKLVNEDDLFAYLNKRHPGSVPKIRKLTRKEREDAVEDLLYTFNDAMESGKPGYAVSADMSNTLDLYIGGREGPEKEETPPKTREPEERNESDGIDPTDVRNAASTLYLDKEIAEELGLSLYQLKQRKERSELFREAYDAGRIELADKTVSKARAYLESGGDEAAIPKFLGISGRALGIWRKEFSEIDAACQAKPDEVPERPEIQPTTPEAEVKIEWQYDPEQSDNADCDEQPEKGGEITAEEFERMFFEPIRKMIEHTERVKKEAREEMAKRIRTFRRRRVTALVLLMLLVPLLSTTGAFLYTVGPIAYTAFAVTLVGWLFVVLVIGMFAGDRVLRYFGL